LATTATTVKSTRTINLSKRLIKTHMPRRITNSIRMLREEVARHSKTTPDKVKIGGELNRYLMMGAIQGFYGTKIAIEKTGEDVKVDLAEKRKIPISATAGKTEEKREAKSLKEKLTEKSPAEKAKEEKEAAEKAKKEKKETTPKSKEVKKEAPQNSAVG
jgi:ribosomal protein L31E